MAEGAEPIQRRWRGEALVIVLRDAEGSGILGMARETTVRLTADRVQLAGKRMGGLNIEIPLTHLREVKPRLYPVLTLDFEGPGGRVEVPASAHAIEDLAVLAEDIEEAVRKCKVALAEATQGENAEALRDLRRLID